MKFKALFTSTLLVAMLFSCKDNGESIFTDETYQDTIKQNIGGELVRDVHHYDDIHSYDYDIQYSYLDTSDSIRNIGYGNFHGQEPPKNEQLIRFGNWTIFKTSGGREKDLLFICENDKNIWNEYEISPKIIEQTNLWKKQNIASQLDNWDTVAKIDKIDKSGNVTVIYTYAKVNGMVFFKTGKRQITFKINSQTGKPEMIEVSEK